MLSRLPSIFTLLPYPPLFRPSDATATIATPVGVVERAATDAGLARVIELVRAEGAERVVVGLPLTMRGEHGEQARDRKSTRLNSSHQIISYADFSLKKKNTRR